MIQILLYSAISTFSIFFTQDYKNICGQYSYSSPSYLYMEDINFKEDTKFVYKLRMEFFNERIEGYYNITNDTIILNSYPQKDKIIVREDYKKGNKLWFKVTDKQNNPINYHLYLILDNNSIVEFRDQFKESKIKGYNIQAFYFMISSGIISPTYFVKGMNTNCFLVMLEENKVFEAEKWLIKDDEIIPLGLDGNYVNYSLKKRE